MGQCNSNNNLQKNQLLNQRGTYNESQSYMYSYPIKVLTIPAKNEILIQHHDQTIETLKVTFFQYDKSQHRRIYRQIFKSLKLLHCIQQNFYIDQQSVVYYIQGFSSYQDKSFHKAVCMYSELLRIQTMDIANILVADEAYIVQHQQITQKRSKYHQLLPQLSQVQFIIKSKPIQVTKLIENQSINNSQCKDKQLKALRNKSLLQFNYKNQGKSTKTPQFSSQPSAMLSQQKNHQSLVSLNSNGIIEQTKNEKNQVMQKTECKSHKTIQSSQIFRQKLQKAYINIQQLGKHMKNKNIKWFDKQFQSVALNAIYWMNNMHKANCYGIKKVLIGKNGHINFVGIDVLCENRSMRQQLRDLRKLSQILLSTLRGYEWERIQGAAIVGNQKTQKAKYTFEQLETNFPLSSKMIAQLRQGTIQERELIAKVSRISQSGDTYKRYINGYIQSFFSNPQNDQIIIAIGYQQLGIFEKAKPLIIKALEKAQYQSKFSEQSASLLQMLIANQNAIYIHKKPQTDSIIMNLSNQKAKGLTQFKQTLLEIYQHLGMAYFQDGEYLKADSFFSKAIVVAIELENTSIRPFFKPKQFEPSQEIPIEHIKQDAYLKESHYIKRAQIKHYHMKYTQAQDQLYQGLRKFPQSKQIFIYLIDILLQQGQWRKCQLLFKSGSSNIKLTNCEQIYVATKIYFNKSLCTCQIKNQYINLMKAIECAICQVQKQNHKQIVSVHLLKADLNFNKGMYKEAKQNYENCKLIFKSNETMFKHNKVTCYQVQQSIGNCCFLLGLNQQALKHYNEAFQSLSSQLQERRVIIVGNMGLVQASKNANQANQTLNYTLKKIKQHPFLTDESIHYKFFSQRQQFYIPVDHLQ